MGSLWVWAAALAVLVYLLTPPGPTYDRRVPLGRVRERTARLAIMRPGATLRVEHLASGGTLSFSKGDDSGNVEQTIDFLFSEDLWPPQAFGKVSSALREAPFVSRSEIEGTAPTRVLRCSLTARPISMPILSGELLARIAPELGFQESDKFTVRATGVENYAIWRRMNADSFRHMAEEHPSSLYRAFGRYQLRKLDSERRGPPESDA